MAGSGARGEDWMAVWEQEARWTESWRAGYKGWTVVRWGLLG